MKTLDLSQKRIEMVKFQKQKLVRITRFSAAKFSSEEIANVRFVPLIGAEGWKDSP